MSLTGRLLVASFGLGASVGLCCVGAVWGFSVWRVRRETRSLLGGF